MTERDIQYAGDKFCSENILANQTTLVERLITLEEIETDDILIETAEVFNPNQNKFVVMNRNEYDKLYIQLENELSEMNENNLTSDNEKSRFTALSEFFDNDPSFSYIDVFGWYLVSDYLERLLEKEGEIILKTEYGNWWGRQCTGQSLQFDGALRKIIIESIKQESITK